MEPNTVQPTTPESEQLVAKREVPIKAALALILAILIFLFLIPVSFQGPLFSGHTSEVEAGGYIILFFGIIDVLFAPLAWVASIILAALSLSGASPKARNIVIVTFVLLFLAPFTLLGLML